MKKDGTYNLKFKKYIFQQKGIIILFLMPLSYSSLVQHDIYVLRMGVHSCLYLLHYGSLEGVTYLIVPIHPLAQLHNVTLVTREVEVFSSIQCMKYVKIVL